MSPWHVLAPLLGISTLLATLAEEPRGARRPAGVVPPSSAPAPIPPTAPPDPEAGLAATLHADALARGDQETADAVVYNLLHLRSRSSDERTATAALEELAKSGDAFTLEWLASPEFAASPHLPRALVKQAKTNIRERLRRSPATPQVVASTTATWLLRAAVSDVTCNALESTFAKYRVRWLQRHRTTPGVPEALRRLAAVQAPDAATLSAGTVRARAARYAAAALAAATAPPTKDSPARP